MPTPSDFWPSLSSPSLNILLTLSARDLKTVVRHRVTQGSVYLLFTADLATTSNTMLGTFADGTAILACHEYPPNRLQKHVNMTE